MNAKNLQSYLEGGMPGTIGERIDLFLLKKNITRAKFGKDLGITGTTIASYCTGKSKPNSDFLQQAADIFDINPMWLLFGQGPMFLSQAGEQCFQASAEPAAPSQDEQLVELKHRLAEQILAGIEERDRQSKRFGQTLEALARTAKAYGLTNEQHLAIMDAVLDPEQAMAALEAAESHHSAAGNE